MLPAPAATTVQRRCYQALAEDETTDGSRTPDTQSRLTARSAERASGAVQEVLRRQHKVTAAVTI